jgi:hypothetical protein
MLGPAATPDYRQIVALDERWLGPTQTSRRLLKGTCRFLCRQRNGYWLVAPTGASA